MINIATYFEVQSVFTDKAIALVKRYCESSRAEKGNAGVDAVQETPRHNRMVVIESWKDEPAFREHETSTTTSEFRSALKTIQLCPYDQRVHQNFSVSTDAGTPDDRSLCIVTHVDVPPPRREETEVLLRNLVEPSRRDEGNLRYDIFQQLAPRTNHFTVVAIWSDAAAFASHETKPHTLQFREALGPMLGAPYDERLYQAVGSRQ